MPKLDLEASTIAVRTRAKGMLARLAHDLEIAATRFEGEVTTDGDAWTATLSVAVAGLNVAGVLKNGRVDRNTLSASDKSEIERRIRAEVLPIDHIGVSLRGKDRTRADVTVSAARGKQSLSVPLRTETRDGALIVFGELELSLDRLGVREVKAPLGAFRVDDAIEVAFWIKLADD